MISGLTASEMRIRKKLLKVTHVLMSFESLHQKFIAKSPRSDVSKLKQDELTKTLKENLSRNGNFQDVMINEFGWVVTRFTKIGKEVSFRINIPPEEEIKNSGKKYSLTIQENDSNENQTFRMVRGGNIQECLDNYFELIHKYLSSLKTKKEISSNNWSSKLNKTREAMYRSQEFLWKSCIKTIKKNDVWEIELQHYHIILKVSAKKLKNNKHLGFLRYKIKGLEQWQDFVNVTDSHDPNYAKQHTVLNFLSFLKSDEVQKIYGNPPLTEPELPKLSENENYQIQYELDGKLAGPPTDLKLTSQLRIVKLSGYNSQTFRVLVTGNADSKEKAILESKKIVNDFLDYYCVRTEQTLKMLNDGRPHSITFDDQSDMELDFSLEYFIPDETIISTYSKELEKIRYDSELNYIKNALKYYRKARNEKEPEEKLVNYFIALEALYSGGTEITFRFSMRISTLLGIESNDILEIFNDAQTYYGDRSKAVHGKIISMDKNTIKKIDSWVRKSIMSFTELSESYSTQKLVINAIDYAIVDFEFRDLIHSLVEPANQRLEEKSHRYQHEFE